jgi:hypothetical protein
MNTASKKFIAGCLVVLAGCATTQSNDAMLASRLVGKWGRTVEVEGGRFETTAELAADGTFRTRGVKHTTGGSEPFSTYGVWQVENGVFRWKTTPHQFYMAHKIVSISDWQWIWVENLGGAHGRWWRIPE